MAPPRRGRAGRGPDEIFLFVAVVHLLKLHGINQDVLIDAELLLQHQCDLFVTTVNSEGSNDTLEERPDRPDQSGDCERKPQG